MGPTDHPDDRSEPAPARGRDGAASRKIAMLSTEVERLRRMRTVLLATMAGGRVCEAEVATAVAELTGRAVAIEDTYGHPRAAAAAGGAASAGSGTGPEPVVSGWDRAARTATLERARDADRPVWHRGRVWAVLRYREEILGAVVLEDPGRTAGAEDHEVMEIAAAILAMELSGRRAVAEAELRLGRELIEDLLHGTDANLRERALALGHDLDQPHRVLVLACGDRVVDRTTARVAERAAAEIGSATLTTRVADTVVLLASRPVHWVGGHRWDEFHASLAEHIRSGVLSVGVGDRTDDPAGVPDSYVRATQALRLRQRSSDPHGLTVADGLGIYRVLGSDASPERLDAYTSRWLGSLVTYDRDRGGDLVATLAAYLDAGGHYTRTAAALHVHRSTLRYRLHRICEITGYDLGDVDTRLNLHLATRAWKIRPQPS